MKYKVLIFDLHETVLYSNGNYFLIFQKLVKKYLAKSIKKDEFDKARKLVWDNIGDSKIIFDSLKLVSDQKIEYWWACFHAEVLRNIFPDITMEKAYYVGTIFNKIYCKDFTIFDFNSKATIEELSKNFTLVLCSNSMSASRKIVNYFHLNKYFEYIVIAGEAQVSKPDKKIVDLIENFTNIERQCFLIIGDSKNHDVELGITAGVDSCYVLNGRAECLEATYNINDISSLKSFL